MAGFSFKSLCKAINDQLSMQCNVVNLTAHCFNFRSLFYISAKAKVTLEVEWNIPNGTPGDVVPIVTKNGWKLFKTMKNW